MSQSLVRPVFSISGIIRRVRQSLDAELAATLVNAFVTSRVDYTVTPYWPGRRRSQQTSCKLQRVMNSAARVVINTRKFDSGLLSRLLHDELHWLDVADRVFKLAVLVWNCSAVRDGKLHTNSRRRQSSTPAVRQSAEDVVPRYRMDSYGRWCFAVARPSTWNSLPDSLRDPAPVLELT